MHGMTDLGAAKRSGTIAKVLRRYTALCLRDGEVGGRSLRRLVRWKA